LEQSGPEINREDAGETIDS